MSLAGGEPVIPSLPVIACEYSLHLGGARDARLLDPSRRVHRLEETQRALDHRPIFLSIVAASKAAIGEERLSQLRARLDFLEYIETTAKRSICLGVIALRSVDLPQHAMRRAFFESEPTSLRNAECLVSGTQGLVRLSRGEVNLRERNLWIRDVQSHVESPYRHPSERVIDQPSRISKPSQL